MKKQVVYLVVAGVLAVGFSSGSLGAGSESSLDGRAPAEFEPPVVFQAAGPSVASIQSTVDQYRLALGDPLRGNAPGPLPDGRREIGWDGGGSATTPGPTPFDAFLNIRGARMTTPGTGFVQAPPSGLADISGNPSYVDILKAFSPQRLFSAIDSNLTTVEFFIPGTNGATPATTKGFGVVFTDVDQPDGGPGRRAGNGASTVVKYYDVHDRLLYSGAVPSSPGDGSFSFLGIVFTDARIAKVRIFSGNVELGRDDAHRKDVVAMDDFIYGEPQIIDNN